MAKNELTAFRGDDKDITIEVKDSDDNAVDISGWTIWFTVKKSADDADSDAVIGPKKVTSHTDASSGKSTVSLTNSDTDLSRGTYIYDIQTDDGSGKITTWGKGDFTIMKDVTDTTS